jgi:hypothetical protein
LFGSGPGPDRGPGRPTIATIRTTRFVRKPARARDSDPRPPDARSLGPVRRGRVWVRSAPGPRRRWVRSAPGPRRRWVRSARRSSADRKRSVVRFALPLPQVFRILGAHIRGPRRLGPGERRPPMTPTPRRDGRRHDVEAGCPREDLSISSELTRIIKAESFLIIIVMGAASVPGNCGRAPISWPRAGGGIDDTAPGAPRSGAADRGPGGPEPGRAARPTPTVNRRRLPAL